MKLLFLFIFSLTFYFQGLQAQETVFAEAGSESGRGILKTRGDECFAIIPNHLLRDHFGTVSIYGEGSVLGEADFVKSYTADLAILRFSGKNGLACTDWKVDRDFDKVISVITKCKLELREKSGGIRTIAMSVTGIEDQFIYVQPDNFREKIAKGMSGSSIFTEYNGRKVYVGMLQSVDGNTGEILMADEMTETLDEFFNPKKKIRRGAQDSKVSLGIVRESGGYKFELVDLERNGSNLNLKFNVVSLNRDNDLRIDYNNISLFDGVGLETKPANIILGSQSSYRVHYNMIHGISVPLELNFNNLSSSAKDISLLKFHFKESNTDRSFELRDLELPEGTSYGSQYDGSEISGTSVISGFKFELLHISKNGQEVICKFNVTSEDRDRELSLDYNKVFLYDNKGYENKAANFVLGDKSSYRVRHNMIHGIPTPLEIKFTTVNSSAESIALLKMGFSSSRVNSEYQQRNISFESFSSGGESSSTGCSEIYFYRMKGFTQCSEDVVVSNHGEQIVRLPAGSRFKTVVCDNREFDFKANTGREELIGGAKKPAIQLGKNYYFKVACTLGVTVISQQDAKKGESELNKKGKYKQQIQTFQLNKW